MSFDAYSDQLLNTARVKLAGASQAGVLLEYVDTLREFFNDSSAWMETVPIAIVAGTVSYGVSLADGAQIVRLAGVLDKNNMPQPATMPVPGTIVFQNPYSNAQTFTATLVASIGLPVTAPQDLPTTGQYSVPDPGVGAYGVLPKFPSWVLPIWGYGILDGLLGRMMGQKDKPYSDAKLSVYHLARFRDVINRARTAALRRNTIGTQAWIFPQTYRTRGQRGGVAVGNDSMFGSPAIP